MEEEEFGYGYFSLISVYISRYIWARMPLGDQVKMKDKVKLAGVKFLGLFCLCLENWDLTNDEQSRERLKSMMTVLKVIWAKEHDGRAILDRVMETDVQDLHSVIIELEGRIHQSKLHIQGWCRNLLRSSSIQFKSTTCSDVSLFFIFLKCNLYDLFIFRAAEMVPFRKHVAILYNMIDFLHESLNKFEYCTENKNCIAYLNFVNAFSNKAACLACMYWAKEANEETAIEMNIIFFDMMLHFIPLALDVTSCYLSILCSTENLQSEETIASFVDFFFEHLAITLKDDFPILRDRLIYLFTFITDHPCQDDDLFCSQIYTLFREDAYLLLSFDEMKEDLSKNNPTLTEFMINIWIANANIRQRYYILSYSWIGLEAVKMDYLYFVLVQRALCALEQLAKRACVAESQLQLYEMEMEWACLLKSQLPLQVNGLEWACLVESQLHLYRMELGFLRASLLWFVTLDDGDEEVRARLNSVIVSLQCIWGSEEEKEGYLFARLNAMRKGRDIANWHPLAFELERKIELSKQEISTQLLVKGFHWSLQSKPSTSNKILKLLDSILYNLNALVRCKASKIVPFRKQIEILKDKLAFLWNIMKLTENCTYSSDLGEFIMFVQVFVNEAACLSILYWVKEANDKTASEINHILSHMLQKIKPAATPDVARLYLETLKAIYLQRSDPLLFGQTASIYVDFILEDYVTLFNDDFQILRDNVIFLLTFLNDPPEGDVEELIFSQIDDSFWVDFYGLLPIDDMNEDFSAKKVRLSDFMIKIQKVNAMIRNIYCHFPDSSLYDLPKITSPWHLDFLLQNLRNLKERMTTDRKFVIFAKCKILQIEKELISLNPFFNYIFKLQNELNNTWLQVVDVVHLSERVINSCIRSWFVFDHPIWYYMAYLSDVLDKIDVVKTEIKKIKENNMYNAGCLHNSARVISTHSKQVWTSEFNELVVGFEDEAKKIFDDLTRGHKSLNIVSIVGMGGLGKTTLAKKVSALVKDHFHILAFYTVSQDHNSRMLLLGILKYVLKVEDEISLMTNDDLAHKLWKCLSRQKYLIVLDDIWSISAWNEVKGSFPDDQNGSRIMFTTRSHDVANKCKMQCNPLHLRFLSNIESWELLQKKVFQNDISPPNLSNIGRLIAESCKGLPLAIVAIAGVLARKEKSESSWSEIAENLVSYLSEEGCTKILELSYNHLPEYLKPCILYLGAFPEDELFTVKQVIPLWIAEGFVQESETKTVEDVGKEYLYNLADRSLIIVSGRSCMGKIKTFSVHDLIHSLCQTKCHEGKFFKLGCGIATSSSSYHSDHYRISDVDVPPTMSNGSLLLRNASTLLLFRHVKVHDFPGSIFTKLKLAQVLYVENKKNLQRLTSLVNLRHLEVRTPFQWIPSSISNLWNIQSLILGGRGIHYLPESLWKMKSLRHVKVGRCKLQFSDGHEQLDKVISFSTPILFTGKDVERLLQRLPAVRKLRIELVISLSDDNRVETLDFYRKVESLKLSIPVRELRGKHSYFINFPSSLKKLTLEGLELPLTTISSIAELHCLRVLKLRLNSFTGPRMEMEDVTFNHLVFFELNDLELAQWNASIESFPCLEQLSIGCIELEKLPPCFGEMSTLKRITVRYCSPGVGASALRICEEQMDLGNDVKVTVKENW